ncbi:unnamed protein product [Chrysoparadoxa australica]
MASVAGVVDSANQLVGQEEGLAQGEEAEREFGDNPQSIPESSAGPTLLAHLPQELLENIPTPFVGPDPEYLPENQEPEGPYYWEEPEVEQEKKSLWDKVRHNIHYFGAKALDGAEAVGEVVAGTLGLTDSKFQYVVDALEQEAWEREQQALALAREAANMAPSAPITPVPEGEAIEMQPLPEQPGSEAKATAVPPLPPGTATTSSVIV